MRRYQVDSIEYPSVTPVLVSLELVKKMNHNAMVANALYPTEEESFQDRWGLFLSQKRNH